MWKGSGIKLISRVTERGVSPKGLMHGEVWAGGQLGRSTGKAGYQIA